MNDSVRQGNSPIAVAGNVDFVDAPGNRPGSPPQDDVGLAAWQESSFNAVRHVSHKEPTGRSRRTLGLIWGSAGLVTAAIAIIAVVLVGGNYKLLPGTDNVLTPPGPSTGWDPTAQAKTLVQRGQLGLTVPAQGTVGSQFEVRASVTVNGALTLSEANGRLLGTYSGLRAGRNMVGSLRGAGFKIEAVSAPRQPLTADSVAHWVWRVTPQRSGSDRVLHLAAWSEDADGNGYEELDAASHVVVLPNPAAQKSRVASTLDWFTDQAPAWLLVLLVIPLVAMFRRMWKVRAVRRAIASSGDLYGRHRAAGR
jgi:hypothetical protein